MDDGTKKGCSQLLYSKTLMSFLYFYETSHEREESKTVVARTSLVTLLIGAVIEGLAERLQRRATGRW